MLYSNSSTRCLSDCIYTWCSFFPFYLIQNTIAFLSKKLGTEIHQPIHQSIYPSIHDGVCYMVLCKLMIPILYLPFAIAFNEMLLVYLVDLSVLKAIQISACRVSGRNVVKIGKMYNDNVCVSCKNCRHDYTCLRSYTDRCCSNPTLACWSAWSVSFLVVTCTHSRTRPSTEHFVGWCDVDALAILRLSLC